MGTPTTPATAADASGKKPYTAPTFHIHMWGISSIAQYFMWKEFDLFRTVLMLSFGFDPMTVGTIYAVPRVLDAFMDPIMGHLSDISNTRWGRRKPFLFVSSLLAAGLLLILYLAEPSWPMWLQIGYLTAVLTLYYYTWGTYEMNRVAMSYELSDDYNVRSRIQAIGTWWGTMPQLIGSMAYFFVVLLSKGDQWEPTLPTFPWDFGLWLSAGLGTLVALVMFGIAWMGDITAMKRRVLNVLGTLVSLAVVGAVGYGLWDLFFRPGDWLALSDLEFPGHTFFSIGFPNLGSEIEGVRCIAVICAVIIIVFGFIPVLFIKERQRIDLRKGKHVGLIGCLREALKNRPFVLIIFLRLAETMGAQLYVGFTTVISIYYVCGGNKLLSEGVNRIGPAWIGAIVASVVWPLAAPITRKLGKRKGLILGYGLSLLSVCTLPLVTRPGWVWIIFFHGLVFMIPGAMRGMFLSSTMPDICDVDELKSGERREGLYSSVLTFIAQLEVSICTFVSGFLLSQAGFNSMDAKNGILPSDEVLQRVLWFAFTPLIFFTAVAFVITWFMPLTPEVMAKVRAELEIKRAAALAEKEKEKPSAAEG
jgi:GPH family glycoside/pentoside/hexuronide:cation symporter